MQPFAAPLVRVTACISGRPAFAASRLSVVECGLQKEALWRTDPGQRAAQLLPDAKRSAPRLRPCPPTSRSVNNISIITEMRPSVTRPRLAPSFVCCTYCISPGGYAAPPVDQQGRCTCTRSLTPHPDWHRPSGLLLSVGTRSLPSFVRHPQLTRIFTAKRSAMRRQVKLNWQPSGFEKH